MDNVLYLYPKAPVTMLTEAEHPYPAGVPAVTKYIICASVFPISQSGKRSLFPS